MPSQIDPTRPADHIPALKAELRENLLAAATEINHGGFFLAAAAAAERPTRDKLRESGVSILDFGADPTGAADSREAIQQAIDAVGETGGGVVFMPPGNYKVVNTDLGEAALHITHSNVTLCGAGIYASRLFFRVHGDLDPATNWQLKNGGTEVHRGNGLAIGVPNSGSLVKNIVLRDFEYDGGAGHTGNYSWPADTVTGDGWDITHKGLSVCTNVGGEDILLERLFIHRFRGEVIYRGGGDDGKRIMLRDSRIEDGNSNGWNIIGENLRCEGNLFRLLGQVGEWGSRGIGGFTFVNNICLDCGDGLQIVGMYTFGVETVEPVNQQAVVANNQFKRINNHCVKCTVGNSLIANNLFADFAQTGVLLINATQGMIKPIRAVMVTGNVFRSVSVSSTVGAVNLLGSDAMPLQDVTIENNLIVVDEAGGASCPYAFVVGLPASARNVLVQRNTVIGTSFFARHQNNGGSHWNTLPAANAPMPIFVDNEDRSAGLSRHQTPAITTSGGTTDPIVGGRVRFSHSAAFDEPTIDPQYYRAGYRITVLPPTANAPTYIPRRSASFRCQADRYLYSGCELDLEFDGTRFIEVGWRDGRADAETAQTGGATLDGLGRPLIVLSYGSAATITAHQAIPEGVPVIIRATNGNATLADNAIIATVSGSDLTLESDRPYVFVRVGAVLRQTG